jgi:hypothetical protein
MKSRRFSRSNRIRFLDSRVGSQDIEFASPARLRPRSGCTASTPGRWYAGGQRPLINAEVQPHVPRKGITAYLENRGALEKALQMAAHASTPHVLP